ncbi:hypothetical protein ES708_23473 [subsurface metagenome]
MNNNQATINKLETMRLHGMARAFRATMETGVKHSFTPDELLSHLVDTDWETDKGLMAWLGDLCK